MSTLKLLVDEETRKLIDYNNTPVFVIKDTNVNTVRFAIPSGFSDIELTEDTAFRVMYIPPGVDRTVKTKTLTFAENNGDYLYYDWEAPPSVFEKTGILTIALCILKNGDEVQGWHTVPYQIYIYNTLHTDDSDAGDETITPTLAERVALLEAIVQWGDRLERFWFRPSLPSIQHKSMIIFQRIGFLWSSYLIRPMHPRLFLVIFSSIASIITRSGMSMRPIFISALDIQSEVNPGLKELPGGLEKTLFY